MGWEGPQGGLRRQRQASENWLCRGRVGHVPWLEAQLPHLPHQPIWGRGGGVPGPRPGHYPAGSPHRHLGSGKGGQERGSDRVYKHRFYWGRRNGGGGMRGAGLGSVLLQAPEHGSRHTLLLQPHLWERREATVIPGGGAPPVPPPKRPAHLAGPLPLGSRSISSSSSSPPSSISSGLACWASSASSSRDASLLGVGRGEGGGRQG